MQQQQQNENDYKYAWLDVSDEEHQSNIAIVERQEQDRRKVKRPGRERRKEKVTQ